MFLTALGCSLSCGGGDDDDDDASGGDDGSRGGRDGAGTGGADPSGGDDSGAGGSVISAGAGGSDAGAGGSDEPYPPLTDRNRDVVDTTLDVDLENDTATATITIAPSMSRGLTLEVGDLTIESVRSAGDVPLAFERRPSGLDIGVPPSTEPLAISIDYAFSRHPDLRGVAAEGYTYTWPNFCGNVFPCRSDPADGMTFHLSVRGGEGTAVYADQIANDAPSYMLAWSVGDYTEVEAGETTLGTSVSLFYLLGFDSPATSHAPHLLNAFEWLEQTLGPYRFGSKVGSVQAPWGNLVGGMEHHPFWHVGSASWDDLLVHLHEASHGWFGNGVRLRCPEDLVLSEGTASYLAVRLIEHVRDVTFSDATWRDVYEPARTSLRVAWPQSCGRVTAQSVTSDAVYGRGALFYGAIEQRVGRPLLDESLRVFYERWAGEAATMQDMLDVIAEVTGYDPAPCATDWLIEPGEPDPASCL